MQMVRSVVGDQLVLFAVEREAAFRAQDGQRADRQQDFTERSSDRQMSLAERQAEREGAE